MELLLILGALALIVLVAGAAFWFLQQRRAGTIRAVIPPRRGTSEGDNDGSAAAEWVDWRGAPN